MKLSDVNDAVIRKTFLKESLPKLVSNSNASKKPLWGQMTAQQMVEHLIWTFDVSIGKIKVDCHTPPEKIEAYKKFLFSDIPTKQYFRNPELIDGLPVLSYENLKVAIRQLEHAISEFYTVYEFDDSKKEVHPIFGVLEFEAWERAHFKHCFHHLKQFGLLTP